MRTGFHAELDRLTSELGEMCALTGTVMHHATAALVHADEPSSTPVRTDLARLDALKSAVGDRAFSLLALQAPVARDLRVVVSAIQIAADAHRMGGLAANVIRVARRHHDDRPIPATTLEHFAAMGRVAVELSGRVTTAVVSCDDALAQRIQDDGAMDELHRGLFALVADDDWTHGAAAAADAVLLGRFHGRFADHAAEIARRVVFQALGRVPVDATLATH